jgi:hypothetical protein
MNSINCVKNKKSVGEMICNEWFAGLKEDILKFSLHVINLFVYQDKSCELSSNSFLFSLGVAQSAVNHAS